MIIYHLSVRELWWRKCHTSTKPYLFFLWHSAISYTSIPIASECDQKTRSHLWNENGSDPGHIWVEVVKSSCAFPHGNFLVCGCIGALWYNSEAIYPYGQDTRQKNLWSPNDRVVYSPTFLLLRSWKLRLFPKLIQAVTQTLVYRNSLHSPPWILSKWGSSLYSTLISCISFSFLDCKQRL